MSRTDLGEAVIIGGLSVPGLLELVANIVVVTQLIISYLGETSRKNDRDSFAI